MLLHFVNVMDVLTNLKNWGAPALPTQTVLFLWGKLLFVLRTVCACACVCVCLCVWVGGSVLCIFAVFPKADGLNYWAKYRLEPLVLRFHTFSAHIWSYFPMQGIAL